jgi:hypothetical protein
MVIPILSDLSHQISKDYRCFIEDGPDAGVTFERGLTSKAITEEATSWAVINMKHPTVSSEGTNTVVGLEDPRMLDTEQLQELLNRVKIDSVFNLIIILINTSLSHKAGHQLRKYIVMTPLHK